jgi:hypothetical protein
LERIHTFSLKEPRDDSESQISQMKTMNKDIVKTTMNGEDSDTTSVIKDEGGESMDTLNKKDS